MFWKRLYLLLWKNFILRKRHPVRTIAEILWPLLLFGVLVAIRKTQQVDTQEECHYPARAMPSAGVFPWIKSVLCDLQNPCFRVSLPSEVPGQVNSPPDPNNNNAALVASLSEILTLVNENTTILENITQLTTDLQYLASLSQNLTAGANNTLLLFSSAVVNPTQYRTFLLTNLSLSAPVADSLLASQISVLQVLQIPLVFSQRQVVCNTTLLSNTFRLNSSYPANITTISNELCDLTDAQLGDLSTYTTTNLVNLTELIALVNENTQFSLNELVQVNQRIAEYQAQLTNLIGPFSIIAQGLNNQASNNSLISSLLGFDPNSPTAFNDFCGHPYFKPTPTSLALSSNIAVNFTEILDNFVNSTESSNDTFCADVINALESNSQVNILWEGLKPIILGKLLYTPDTPLTRSIIEQANSTFAEIGNLENLGQQWQTSIGPSLYQSLESGQNAQALRSLLANPAILNTLSSQLNISVENLQQLAVFLSNENDPRDNITTWKDLYSQINSGIVIITKVLGCVELDKYVGYDTEQDLVVDGIQLANNDTLWAGIVFENPSALDTELPRIIKYKIRQDAGEVTRTTTVQSFFWRPGAESGTRRVKYFVSGFVQIQDIIENAVIKSNALASNQSGAAQNNFLLGSYLQEMPYPCYTRDRFLEYLSSLLSLLMTLAWIFSVCIIIKNIVYEKEQRLKEVMKMMGLSNGVHWVAWFINSFVIMFVSIVLLVIILRAGDVTPYSNMFIIILWLCCFAIATISQCFLISCFFSKANLAAACGGIIYFILYIPYNMVVAFEDRMTLTTKIIASLLSSVSFGYGAGYISRYEMSGQGIQFSNWNTSPDPDDDYNFAISLIMMLVDAAIYLLLTWYIENVFPGKYGIPRRWYFFVQRSYWCSVSHKIDDSFTTLSTFENLDPDIKLEAEPQNLTLGVAVKKLKKVYSNGKVAVEDLSLNFYEGQITSFLGHNGAGKTTTMSMLTGLFPPTSGTASIYGNDIRSEMDEIRHRLGFCPQHNVLFGHLTVMEHLRFYAGLKSAMSGNKTDKEEIRQMLNDVGLPHKKDELARHLSGGMKRKLSVAVAFVGGSKCVILDEPTAGVDPYARRGIWDLLLRYRANRTIILSTHHMDEADLLGDRIAIINEGKLKCFGSSLFLKGCFGVGYYLTVVKPEGGSPVPTPSEPAEKLPNSAFITVDEGFESGSSAIPSSSASSVSSSSDNETGKRTSSLQAQVQSVIPKAKLHEETARELTFILPYSAQSEGGYVELLTKLDNQNYTFGLTDTSLEEIFLNVAQQSEEDEVKGKKSCCCCCMPRKKKKKIRPSVTNDDQARIHSGTRRRTTSTPSSEFSNLVPLVPRANSPDDQLSEDLSVDDGSDGSGSFKITGNKLVLQQFNALFVKRFHHARRNRKGFVASVIVPAIFVALALAFALIIPEVTSFPPLELQPWMYDDTNFFYSNDDPIGNLSTPITESLIDNPGIGMRCVNGYTVLNYNDDFITCDNIGTQNWTTDVNAIRGFSQAVDSNDTLVCECTDKQTRVLLAECPIGAGGDATPQVLAPTSDTMYNMTGRNVSDWLVKTVDRFIQERYGGLSLGEKFYATLTPEQITPIIEGLIATSNISGENVTFVRDLIEGLFRSDNAKVWFDNNGFHSMPTWLNILNNAALRSKLPPGANPADYGISVVNHPLNFTQSQVDLAAFSQSATDTLISICVIFALSFVPASFVLFLIEERVSKAKHLQFVSGVNQSIYWISNFTWDMINYAVPTVIVIIIFLCFQTKAYVSADNLPVLVCLLFLYGFAITPMMYPASFYFKVPSTAYVVLTCLNLFIGINASIATFILELLDDENLENVNYYLKRIFLIFPQYCLGRGLIDMAVNQAYADAFEQFGIDEFRSPFEFDLVGRNLLAMALIGIFFFIFTLLIQYRFFIKPGIKTDLSKVPTDVGDVDDDVRAEQKRVLEQESHDIIKIKNLVKIYKQRGTGKPLVAVDRLSVGIPKGECFGLLGVNGAGKTTTFKMLTGDTTPSAGEAFICEQSILGNIREVQQNTGYCPQFEALNNLLTGREHLAFYAKLRGVPPGEVGRVADWGIKKFGLELYKNKTAGTYSGGNKRKLSAAIAFIGCPPIVFLDEPTAGMDPMSRRFLWSRIAEAVRGGRCIVLTSHSMEECEALCTRLAIMVNGSFKCLGTPQHIKNKYGEGYTVTVKVSGLNPDTSTVKDFMTTSFKEAKLKESHCNTLMYQLSNTKLSHMFQMLESNKAQVGIEDYSISQTTLDEVFVGFAKLQTDGRDEYIAAQTSEEEQVPFDDITVVGGIPMSDVSQSQTHLIKA